MNIQSGYSNLMTRFRILGCSCAQVRQTSCAQGFGAARVVVRIAQFRISRMVSRSRSWRGPSARKFGRRSSGRAKHEKGAPAFDAVLDEQAQRDQMHDRRLPGTPFGPIPGMPGHVAVHHRAAPTRPGDPTLVSAWTWT